MLKVIALTLLGSVFMSHTVYAREFLTTDLTFSLYVQDILGQPPRPLGVPVEATFLFSDDGTVVTESGQREHGVKLNYRHTPGEFSQGELQIRIEVTTVLWLINAILPSNDDHLNTVTEFFSLSLAQLVPLNMPFDESTFDQSKSYQFHSPYRNQENSAYHLKVTATRPLQIAH